MNSTTEQLAAALRALLDEAPAGTIAESVLHDELRGMHDRLPAAREALAAFEASKRAPAGRRVECSPLLAAPYGRAPAESCEDHTAEPWAVRRDVAGLVTGGFRGATVADCRMVQGERGTANARRIVACVNACAGIPTEALERARHLILTHDEGAAGFATVEVSR